MSVPTGRKTGRKTGRDARTGRADGTRGRDARTGRADGTRGRDARTENGTGSFKQTRHAFSAVDDVYAARVDGPVAYTEVDCRGRVAVVSGSEPGGLTGKWFGDDIVSVALPTCGTVDSLNVSATAAVIFYETYRQNLGHNVTSKS